MAAKTGTITLSTLREFLRDKLEIPPDKKMGLFFMISRHHWTDYFADVESDETDIISILLSPACQGRVYVEW